MNVVVLQGMLSRAPEVRALPSGDEVVAYEVTTRDQAGVARSVPVSWRSPGRRAPAVGQGDQVTVVGEVQRRFFRAGGSTQSRTEVAASVVVSSRRVKAVRDALAGAVADLTEPGGGR